jgi:hypothetical protein
MHGDLKENNVVVGGEAMDSPRTSTLTQSNKTARLNRVDYGVGLGENDYSSYCFGHKAVSLW